MLMRKENISLIWMVKKLVESSPRNLVDRNHDNDDDGDDGDDMRASDP